MAGKNRSFIAHYPGLRFAETTLVLNEFHVSKSKLPGAIGENARRGIMAEFKNAYRAQHGSAIKSWLEFDNLELEETEESKNQPSGCGCECAGCDQGHHCRKESRGCHM